MSQYRQSLPVGTWMSEAEELWNKVAIPGEKILYRFPDIYTLINSFASDEYLNGCIVVSNYRFFFHGMSRLYQNSVFYATTDEARQTQGFDVDLPTGCIAEVRRLTTNVSNSKVYGFELVAKDFRPTLRFQFGDGGKKSTEAAASGSLMSSGSASRNGASGGQSIIAVLQSRVFCSMKDLFAFSNKETFEDVSPSDGWGIYKPIEEFNRLELDDKNSGWRISELNCDHSLVDTYPGVLVVPQATSDVQLQAVAQYRSRGRLPVLSWIHPVNRAALVRCSQPQSGLSKRRCTEDEEMFRQICNANRNSIKRSSNTGSMGSQGSLDDALSSVAGGMEADGHYVIFDARPLLNAYANRALGGGVENSRGYKGTKYKYLDIANVHVMRSSLAQLHDLVHTSGDSHVWLKLLDKTDWLAHVHRVLEGARLIAQQLERMRRSVLLHCSDGWDRTAQLSSLVMLMLDPTYRTLRGFPILIEKEWIAFGHKFADRTSQGPNGRDNDDEASPIFLQFMDCTWQLMNQFPHLFEFNSDYLVTILENLFTCRFGSFLFNCERERREAKVHENTPSLWAYLKFTGKDGRYTNTLYRPVDQTAVLTPRTEVAALSFWSDFYARWRGTARVRAQRNFSLRLRHFLSQHHQSLDQVVRAGRRLSTSIRKRVDSGSRGPPWMEDDDSTSADHALLLGKKHHEEMAMLEVEESPHATMPSVTI